MRLAALLALVMTFTLGCSTDDILDPIGIALLEVRTNTTGENLDPDGYQVRVSGPGTDSTRDIGINGSETWVVDGGDYMVELFNVEANCTVTDNPRTVEMVDDGETTTVFAVECV